MHAVQIAKLTQQSNLVVKDISIGRVLLLVEGSKPLGFRSDSLRKKFDPLSAWPLKVDGKIRINNNEKLLGAYNYYVVNFTRCCTTEQSDTFITPKVSPRFIKS